MLLLWTLANLFACIYGFRNISFPTGVNQNPHPLPVSSANPRIVGGSPTTIEEYPFAVSLQQEWPEFEHGHIHFCTAAIISESWLITSASCSYLHNFETYWARVGTSIYYDGGQRFEIEYVIVHPLYNSTTNDYDVSLLKLYGTLIFEATIRPVLLPSPDRTMQQDEGITITGWGVESLFAVHNEQLYKAEMSVVTDELCESVYGIGSVTAQMFCAYEEDVGPCIVDSGLPVLAHGVMIGMMSWGHECPTPGYPTVFSNIPTMMEWITEVTGVVGTSSGTTMIPLLSTLTMNLLISLIFA